MSKKKVAFEDLSWEVQAVDKDGNFFDRVSRIDAVSDDAEMTLTLDINIEIYSLVVGDKFTMCLASSLSLDDEPDTGYYNQTQLPSLADRYEYVMAGKVFRYVKEKASANPHIKSSSLYISYGGLLMCIKGDALSLGEFELDSLVYLLIRKQKR